MRFPVRGYIGFRVVEGLGYTGLSRDVWGCIGI